jgi:hypothetical protein
MTVALRTDPALSLTPDMVATQLACMNILTAFCEHVDSGQALRNADLFTHTGHMQARLTLDPSSEPELDATGRQGLTALFTERESMVGRQTKHTTLNPHFQFISETETKGFSTMVVYLLSVEPPASPMIPRAIVECTDTFLRGIDGKWRIDSRSVQMIAGER